MKRLGAATPSDRGSGQASRVAIVVVVCLTLGGLAAIVVDRWPAASHAPAGRSVGTAVTVLRGYNCCAHTPAGAAQAVGIYLAELGGPAVLTSAATNADLDQIADPGTRDQLGTGLAASRQVEESLWGVASAAQEGKHVVLSQTPIAYRVTSYTDQVATVAVWLITTVGVENRQRMAAFFANGSATVVWLDGTWRLHAISNGSAAGDVVPACLQTPTPTGGVPSQLDGFTPYGS